MLLTNLLAGLHLGFVAALPALKSEQSCTEPTKRVEWRELPSSQQQSYIDAVLCLKTKPSRIGPNTSLYDDFAFVHARYNQENHDVAGFLPWHRHFRHVYEGALQECQYTGSATYWDWTLDVKKLLKSDILSPSGFGGDGSATRTQSLSNGKTLNCVDDGPFSNLRPAYYAFDPINDAEHEEYCLHRKVVDGDSKDAETSAKYYNSTYIGIVQESANYTSYRVALESGPHGIVHSSLSGEMNPSTSPNEPLFFLHHAQIDRLWWLWQQKDLSARQSDYGGIAKPNGSTVTVGASLDDLLRMGGLAEDLTVRNVMSTISSPFCYSY